MGGSSWEPVGLEKDKIMARRKNRQGAAVLGLLALFAALVLTGCQAVGPDTPSPTRTSALPSPVRNVVVIGDSLSTGFGTSPANAWPNLIAASHRDDTVPLEILNTAQNGSGYLNVGLTGTTFAWQVEQAVTPQADLVLFFGSVNDLRHDPADLAPVIAEIYASARRRAPHATFLVVGPPAYSAHPEARRLALRDVLERAAHSAGARFVDPIAEGWLVEDLDRFVGPDGLHLSVEGNQHLRDKMEPLMLETLRAKSAAES
ncbi:SGNH/GDSL hydrolase family protein [Paeniglutamicibacter psychrophenolicus]|uniref:SGNH/GDSL hydrolase family protein n=1 Tax=Paeniglutamicibacter psychrophenolicus TaxID=257454 RepID=UPI0027808FB4|nr:SGNH/GDSL hydrolase family protein [Paeniglutamicibacter psychrophenolicus]MDQ0092787.1 lysophospholipase L1-like esterase [Paeniglutamicibacter psychrophenolicus]